MPFIRYNATSEIYEYDSAGGSGAGPWLELRLKNPRVLFQDFTPVNNSSTTETTLFTHTLPAAKLTVDGESLHGYVFGIWTANADIKTVRLKFAGTTWLTLGPAAVNGGTWWVEYVITRISSTQCKIRFICNTNNGAGTVVTISTDVSAYAVTWTNTNDLVVTGQSGTGSNDVTAQGQKIILEPAA